MIIDMILAFYKVSNSQEYGRNEFDLIYDNRKAIIEKLGKLRDDELRCYDITTPTTAMEFVEDYNDEIVDGIGWWCVLIPD